MFYSSQKIKAQNSKTRVAPKKADAETDTASLTKGAKKIAYFYQNPSVALQHNA